VPRAAAKVTKETKRWRAFNGDERGAVFSAWFRHGVSVSETLYLLPVRRFVSLRPPACPYPMLRSLLEQLLRLARYRATSRSRIRDLLSLRVSARFLGILLAHAVYRSRVCVHVYVIMRGFRFRWRFGTAKSGRVESAWNRSVPILARIRDAALRADCLSLLTLMRDTRGDRRVIGSDRERAVRQRESALRRQVAICAVCLGKRASAMRSRVTHESGTRSLYVNAA